VDAGRGNAPPQRLTDEGNPGAVNPGFPARAPSRGGIRHRKVPTFWSDAETSRQEKGDPKVPLSRRAPCACSPDQGR
jgi:hypothetical protein